MTVKAGDETIRLTDILVGEVWLCSGQSNMEWSVRGFADGEAEIKAANHPNIRLLPFRTRPPSIRRTTPSANGKPVRLRPSGTSRPSVITSDVNSTNASMSP